VAKTIGAIVGANIDRAFQQSTASVKPKLPKFGPRHLRRTAPTGRASPASLPGCPLVHRNVEDRFLNQ